MRIGVLALVVMLLSGCAGTPQAPAPVVDLNAPPGYAPHPPPPLPAPPSTPLAELLSYATSLRGVSYHPGGTSPQQGFDCSGFVRHVYGRWGVSLPHNADEMARSLPPILPADPRPGDLVFFNTLGRAHSHVGIYLGKDEFIHAPSSRSETVMVSSLQDSYWRKRLDGVRRPSIAPAQTAK
ncbi:MAG TPA: NlpC/P60 family protein [Gammaproteobacteria bacterium]|nr:NlpC/P60 family protein [Gammaproteobacteria bacterium]